MVSRLRVSAPVGTYESTMADDAQDNNLEGRSDVGGREKFV